MRSTYPAPGKGQSRGRYRTARSRRDEMVDFGLGLLADGVLPSMLGVRELTTPLSLSAGAFWNTFPAKVSYLHAVIDAYRDRSDEAWRARAPESIRDPRELIRVMGELAEADRMRRAVTAWSMLAPALLCQEEGRPGPSQPGAAEGADYAAEVLSELNQRVLRETSRALAELLPDRGQAGRAAALAQACAPWLGGLGGRPGDLDSLSAALGGILAPGGTPVLAEVEVPAGPGRTVTGVVPDPGDGTDVGAEAARVAGAVFPDLTAGGGRPAVVQPAARQ